MHDQAEHAAWAAAMASEGPIRLAIVGGDVAAVLGPAEVADEHARRFLEEHGIGQLRRTGRRLVEQQRLVVAALGLPFFDGFRRHAFCA